MFGISFSEIIIIIILSFFFLDLNDVKFILQIYRKFIISLKNINTEIKEAVREIENIKEIEETKNTKITTILDMYGNEQISYNVDEIFNKDTKHE